MHKQVSPIIIPPIENGGGDHNRKQTSQPLYGTTGTSTGQGSRGRTSGGFPVGLVFQPAGILTLCVPLMHNPEPDGTRFPVDPAKIDATENEIVEFFGGFQALGMRGRWKNQETGEVVEDELIRYQSYTLITIETFAFLAEWLPTLEARFEQCVIFATFESNTSVIQ